MKNLTIFSLILLGLGFFSAPVFADIIPQDSHSLDMCAKVVNLNEFPGIVLIGYYTGPMIEKYEAYQIKDNDCLTKGYKFNTLSIYSATKDKFNSLDLKNLSLKKGAEINHGSWTGEDPATPVDLQIVADSLETYGGYVDEKNPLVKEEIQYSLIKSVDNKFSLQKTKVISEYNNGTPNKIETFPVSKDNTKVGVKPNKIISNTDTKIVTENINNNINNIDAAPVVPAKKGFWYKIACFFGINKNF